MIPRTPAARGQIAAYATLIGGLAGGAWLMARVTGRGNSELHTLLETIAVILGFLTGAIALVRYYTSKTWMFLLLGAGFLGAALLELHHAAVTSSFFAVRTAAAQPALIVGSEVASQVFLSAWMCLCGLACRRNKRNSVLHRTRERTLYLLIGTAALIVAAYFQLGILHRPAELVPGFLFALAAIAFVSNGSWKAYRFEQWLIFSAITAATGHLGYMAFSTQVLDASYITAHLARILAYLFVLTGLVLFEDWTVETVRRSRDELEAQLELRTTDLFRREEQLRTAHAEMELLLASVPSILIGLDSKGHIKLWNSTASQVFGLAERLVIGRPLDNCGIQWLLPDMKRELEGWLRAQTLVRSNDLPYERGRETRFVGFSVRPLLPAKEEPAGFLITGADITARKQMDEALLFSEERFRLAAENASDAILEWDFSTGTILWFGSVRSQDQSRLPGSMEELKRRLHPEDRGRVLAAMQRMRETEQPAHEEYRLLEADGTVRFWSTRGATVREREGPPRRAIGATLDITQRKIAEARLAHLAAIVESSESAIVSLDPEGKIMTWNAAAERIYGFTAEEAKGSPISIVWPPERKPELAEAVHTLLERGEAIQHREEECWAKDGHIVPVLVSYSPLRDGAGNITGGFSVAADLTDRKLLERQLAQAQKLESLGQLSAGLAHEINTPIQYVGDNLRFISEAFNDQLPVFLQYERLLNAALAGEISPGLIDEVRAARESADLEYLGNEVPKALEQSLDGLNHVATIVRAMKSFAHPGSDEKKPADLNKALSDALIVANNELKQVADIVTRFGELPPILCNLGEINQVFLNLLINAAQAIAEVATTNGARGEIHVVTRCEDNEAIVSISDTGCGIPEPIQSRVFDPFFTTKEVGRGSGQGLSVARNIIVERHGGRINFEPNHPRGTKFLVGLPICGARGPSQGSAQPVLEAVPK